MKHLIYSLLFVSTVVLSAPPSLINGAGATFPYPLYSKWFSEFQKIDKDTQINYQSIGSGGGIRQFTDKTVDFGATDVPMTDEQLSKSAEPILHIPTVLGSVVVVYNLPGSPKLKLDPDLVADIFLGNVKKWDDPRITKLNPEAKITGDILIVHRSDGSGTTGVFTDYLSKVSPAWKEKVGQGTAVNWPLGLGGKGNEGVSGLVKQTPGSLGYVEFVYAEQNQLAYASLRNKAGAYVTPSPNSISAAAAGALKTLPADYRVSLTNAEGKQSYPITSFTYLLVYKTMPDRVKGERFVKFLKWAVKGGQSFATDLHYAPLPASVAAKVEKTIQSIGMKKVN